MNTDDPTVYETALAESVHFSFKTINSNIDKGGLRLSQSQALDLPYISARTLMADGYHIPVDYQANAGKTATLFKAINAAQFNEDISEQEPEFQQAVQQVKPILPTLLTTPFQAGTEHVNVRMRQLLIPKHSCDSESEDTEDKGYISISPLTAAGVNHFINQEVDNINQDYKTNKEDSLYFKIKTAIFGIGGANPQNVGSLVRAMQRPIVVNAPEHHPEIRQAYRLFYKGFDYFIPNKNASDKSQQSDFVKLAQMLEQQLLIPQKQPDIDAPDSNLRVRQEEMTYLSNIVNSVLNQGIKPYQLLNKYRDKLPKLENTPLADDSTDAHAEESLSATTSVIAATKPIRTPLLHPSVPLVIQGIIDPSVRDEEWQIEFATNLANRLIKQTYRKDSEQEEIKIPLDSNTESFLSQRIIDLLHKKATSHATQGYLS